MPGRYFWITFQKKTKMFGSRKITPIKGLIKLKIFGSVFGPLEKVCRNLHMKPMQIFDTLFHVFDAQTDKHTDPALVDRAS